MMKADGSELFIGFLAKWTKTLHPLKGVAPYPRYKFLRNTACSSMTNRLLLIPKSRQMMISWTLCALTLFKALTRGGLHLLLSKNQFSADELLRRIMFIYDNLPGRWKLSAKTRNRSELEIADRGRIISLPATEEAPRMHSPTSVFWDEMAFTPRADIIWAALKPCLDSGASFAGVSTPNGSEGIFARLVEEAPINGFAIHRVHWSQHPLRNEAWAMEAKKGLSEVEWRREYEISFEGSSDLIYPEFTGENILPGVHFYNPEKQAYRAIDFGYRHPFVLWIQEIEEGKLVVFDEWAGADATVEEMISVIHKMDGDHGITEEKVLFTACDPAGAAVDSAGVAPIERLKRAGFKMRYRPSRVLTGMEIVKSLLCDANGERKLFLSSSLERLPRDFRRYRWREGGDEPDKDGICDHSLDALRYFAVNYLYAPRPQVVKPRVRGLLGY